MRVIIVFFALLNFCALAQETIPQRSQDQAFNLVLDLYNAENFHALVPAVHSFTKTYGTTTSYQSELKYFEAISSSRLNQKDAEQKLTRFAEEYPANSRAATAQFELASLQYRNKNYQRASEQLSKLDFSKLSKLQNLEARFNLGYSYFNLKRLPEALDQFNFVKGSESVQYSSAASYYAGYIELSTGAYESALRDLQSLEKQSSYSAVVPYLIAQVYQKQNKDDDVIRYVASLSGKDIQNLEEINLLVAEAHFRKKNYQKAIEGYNGFLKGKSIGDRGVMFRAGYSYFSVDKPNEAVELLKKAASDKDSVGVYASYYLGINYLKTNQKQIALAAFQVASRFNKDPKLKEESSFQTGKLLYDLGRADEAIDEMESFQKTYPQSAHEHELSELLSSAYVNASSYHKAIQHIEALPKRSPAIDNAYQRATYLFGTEWFNKNDYPKAVEYFDKSLNYPFDESIAAKAALWAGESFAVSSDWEKTIGYYEKALTFKPEQETIARVRFGLGYARYNQQQYDRALYSFKEYVNNASKADAELSNGYVRLADCYYVSKQYNEALTNYKNAYAINRTDQDYAHLQAGIISGILRQYPQALNEFDVVIKSYASSPYWDEAVFQKAQIDFETNNYGAAQAGYTRLIASRPTSRFVPFAYQRRASASYNLKEYGKAADDYNFLLNQYANHPASKDVLLLLQESLNQAGRGGEMSAVIDKVQKSNPNDKGLESVVNESAKDLYFNQEYQRAITSLTSFITSYPESGNNTEARYYRAESYYRLKDYQKAVDAYREIYDNEKFPSANKVAGRVAELEFKLGHYDLAAEANRKLNKLATTSKEKHNSWLGMMDSYFLINNFDSSLVYANKLLSDAGVSIPNKNKAALFSGKVAMAKGDFETAKDEFLTIINNSSDEFGAEAKYHIAEIQYNTKAYKACRETLFGLIKDYQAYTLWVGKAFLLLADNYVAEDNGFQAKATLKSLDKFPLENIKAEAQTKLKAIEAGELQKEKVEKDSTDRN